MKIGLTAEEVAKALGKAAAALRDNAAWGFDIEEIPKAEMLKIEGVVPYTPEELRRHEIEELKAGWASDPCFDIEDTEGFEDVAPELHQFRLEMERKWEKQRLARLSKLAEELGFKSKVVYEFGIRFVLDPSVFTEYMEKLLGNIAALEDRLEQAEIKLDKIGRG